MPTTLELLKSGQLIFPKDPDPKPPFPRLMVDFSHAFDDGECFPDAFRILIDEAANRGGVSGSLVTLPGKAYALAPLAFTELDALRQAMEIKFPEVLADFVRHVEAANDPATPLNAHAKTMSKTPKRGAILRQTAVPGGRAGQVAGGAPEYQ